jgi:hypothetical protein
MLVLADTPKREAVISEVPEATAAARPVLSMVATAVAAEVHLARLVTSV